MRQPSSIGVILFLLIAASVTGLFPTIASAQHSYSVNFEPSHLEINPGESGIVQLEITGPPGIVSELAPDSGSSPLTVSISSDEGEVPFATEITITANSSASDGSYNIVLDAIIHTDDGGVSEITATYPVNVVTSESEESSSGNSPPVAQDYSYSTDEDSSLAVGLFATDPDNDALTFSIVTPPAHGTLQEIYPINDQTAGVIYRGNTDYHGTDSFTFVATDGVHQSNVATIHLTVNPVNDAPVGTPQSITVGENQEKVITLTAQDIDSSSLTFSIYSDPINGRLGSLQSISETSARITYTPNSGYQGSDAFQFTVSDGQLTSSPAKVSITVEAAPVPLEQPGEQAGGSSEVFVNVRQSTYKLNEGDYVDIEVTNFVFGPDRTIRYEVLDQEGKVIRVDRNNGEPGGKWIQAFFLDDDIFSAGQKYTFRVTDELYGSVGQDVFEIITQPQGTETSATGDGGGKLGAGSNGAVTTGSTDSAEESSGMNDNDVSTNGVPTITENQVNEVDTIPTNASVSDVSSNSITISWTGPEGARYNVYRNTSTQGEFTKINSEPVSELTFTDGSILPDNEYYYYVTAVDGNGVESENSEIIYASTYVGSSSDQENRPVTDGSAVTASGSGNANALIAITIATVAGAAIGIFLFLRKQRGTTSDLTEQTLAMPPDQTSRVLRTTGRFQDDYLCKCTECKVSVRWKTGNNLNIVDTGSDYYKLYGKGNCFVFEADVSRKCSKKFVWGSMEVSHECKWEKIFGDVTIQTNGCEATICNNISSGSEQKWNQIDRGDCSKLASVLISCTLRYKCWSRNLDGSLSSNEGSIECESALLIFELHPCTLKEMYALKDACEKIRSDLKSRLSSLIGKVSKLDDLYQLELELYDQRVRVFCLAMIGKRTAEAYSELVGIIGEIRSPAGSVGEWLRKKIIDEATDYSTDKALAKVEKEYKKAAKTMFEEIIKKELCPKVDDAKRQLEEISNNIKEFEKELIKARQDINSPDFINCCVPCILNDIEEEYRKRVLQRMWNIMKALEPIIKKYENACKENNLECFCDNLSRK